MDGMYENVSATVKVSKNPNGKYFVYLELEYHPLLTAENLFKMALQTHGPESANPKKLARPISWRGDVGPHITLNPDLRTFEGDRVNVIIDTKFLHVEAILAKPKSPGHTILIRVIVRNQQLECMPPGSTCHVTIAQELKIIEPFAKELEAGSSVYVPGAKFYTDVFENKNANALFFRFGPTFGTFREHFDTPYIAILISHDRHKAYISLEEGAKNLIDQKFTNMYQEKFYHIASCKCYFFTLGNDGMVFKATAFPNWQLGNLIRTTFDIHVENKGKICPVKNCIIPTKVEIVETIGIECVNIIGILKANLNGRERQRLNKELSAPNKKALGTYSTIVSKINWKDRKIWNGAGLEAIVLKQIVTIISTCIALMTDGNFQLHQFHIIFPEIAVFLIGKRLDNDVEDQIDTGNFSEEDYGQLSNFLTQRFQHAYANWNGLLADIKSGDPIPYADPDYYEMEELLKKSR